MGIKKVGQFILKSFKTRLYSEYKYVIVDYSDDNNDVYFNLFGNRLVLKKNISEILRDECVIISELWPEQACFLGIKIGIAIKNNSFNDDLEYESKAKLEELNAKRKSKKIKTVSFDRYGSLYFDSGDGKLSCENILVTAQSSDLINKFDSITAYFIGLQLGKNITKYMNQNKEIELEKNGLNVVNFGKLRSMKSSSISNVL